MLEHFARLAAAVGGTTSAAVGLLGYGRDPVPAIGCHRLSPDDSAAFWELDGILSASPTLSVIPDLPSDDRPAAAAIEAAYPDMRFFAYRNLISAGAKHIGFICVMDPNPRSTLTAAEIAGLDHLADMILADRRKEQRHRHLMHVADRALRLDRMLRLVSEATSCAEALDNLLHELCRSHDASSGQILQLVQPNQLLRQTSHYDPRGEAASDDPAADSALLSLPVIASAIRRNEPFLATVPASSGEQVTSCSGMSKQICVPVSVHQLRCAIVLAFVTERTDLDVVMADIVSLAEAIRPSLLRKATEERIRFVAHHDNLTRLANRLMFHERLERTLSLARSDEQRFALLYMDLDGFKSVNDMLGHEVGDKLLVAIAERLRDNVREGDVVARMGGDEFAIIQPFGGQPTAAKALAQRLLQTLSRPVEFDGRTCVVGASIGIAFYPEDGEDADELLRNADVALYRAKAAGRNVYRLFSPELQSDSPGVIGLEQELSSAIGDKQFALNYQPVCDIDTLQPVGFEALLRWNHPVRGPIGPDIFIPFAEASGSIVPLGRWVLETACLEAASWRVPVCLSVNLSPLQFRQPDLLDQIAAALHHSGLPPERLDLEVTEGLLLDDSEQVLHTTQRLQKQGIHITLDDFGTAYASLSYLRRFHFNRIKIDRSFIQAICDDDSALAIVEALLSLGNRLNLSVVAEGVETEDQLETLRKLGCRLIQGYLSGRPMTAAQARALLTHQHHAQFQSQPAL